MPIGPSESGPMWYARARLAVTTWGALVWNSLDDDEIDDLPPLEPEEEECFDPIVNEDEDAAAEVAAGKAEQKQMTKVGKAFHIFLSRVMDRTASFSIALMKELLGQLDLSACTDVVIWSDAGTHFRNYAFLGTVCNEIISEHKKMFHVRTGPEA